MADKVQRSCFVWTLGILSLEERELYTSIQLIEATLVSVNYHWGYYGIYATETNNICLSSHVQAVVITADMIALWL